jgi:hypothetical protein
MRKMFLCSIAVLTLVTCAPKATKRTVIIGDPMTVQRLPSTIFIREKYQLSDTTVAHISGKIYGSFIHHPKDTVTDELAFAKVSLKDLKTKTVFSELTTFDATYSFFIPPATYQLEVQYVGYTPIIVKPLRFEAGEVFQLDANLGQGVKKDRFKIQHTKNRRKVKRLTD